MSNGVTQGNLNVTNSAELLSYVINQTPILRENIDLPVQGESIAPIGKIIMNNLAYKNAFLNTINIIGKTVITRNNWVNPWKAFTDKGTMSYGQQVREIIVDIANVYDYNETVEKPELVLKTEVPNVLSYLHEINFQKYYKTTTSDEQMAMAFERDDLFSLVDQIVNSLYEGMEYDYYQVAKYVLARRVLEGTVTAVQIPDFSTLTDREVVAFIKGYSNDMTFRSPNFNPAGIRKATKFEDQFAVVSTKFDGKFTTNVLATSYFRNDAEMKANYELCDGFGKFDIPRLNEVFAKRDSNGAIVSGEYVAGYEPLTTTEMTALAEIPVAILGRDFFQFYRYGMDTEAEARKTELFNPQTLRTNHWLHTWGVVSSSPFENAIVFTQTAQAVSSVSVSPSSATVSKGQSLQLSASVSTTGFANKGVIWSINEEAYDEGASINQNGVLVVPSSYDNTKSGTAGVYTLEIKTALAEGDKIKVGSTTYTVGASDDTAVKQATALVTALGTMSDYTVTRTSAVVTFTEKSGHYGAGAPVVVVTTTNGKVTEDTTTEAVLPTTPILVTATSVYDNTKTATATITVA